MGEPQTIAERLEARLQESSVSHYVLTLFVTGASDLSGRAITNIRALCEEHLAGRYTLHVVDVHKDPQLMSSYDLVAASPPTAGSSTAEATWMNP